MLGELVEKHPELGERWGSALICTGAYMHVSQRMIMDVTYGRGARTRPS